MISRLLCGIYSLERRELILTSDSRPTRKKPKLRDEEERRKKNVSNFIPFPSGNERQSVAATNISFIPPLPACWIHPIIALSFSPFLCNHSLLLFPLFDTSFSYRNTYVITLDFFDSIETILWLHCAYILF